MSSGISAGDCDMKYRPTAAYGHMGREELGVSWEKTDKTEELKKALNVK